MGIDSQWNGHVPVVKFRIKCQYCKLFFDRFKNCSNTCGPCRIKRGLSTRWYKGSGENKMVKISKTVKTLLKLEEDIQEVKKTLNVMIFELHSKVGALTKIQYKTWLTESGYKGDLDEACKNETKDI